MKLRRPVLFLIAALALADAGGALYLWQLWQQRSAHSPVSLHASAAESASSDDAQQTTSAAISQVHAAPPSN